MISKLRAATSRTPVKARTVDVAVKKLAARAQGYVGSSAFEGARQSGKILGGVVQTARELQRATSRDFKQIRSGLRAGNDAAVRLAVGGVGARLGLKLPDLSRLSGWGSVGALGGALGHPVGDTFTHHSLRGVMKVCAARANPINDPDPSNTRVF